MCGGFAVIAEFLGNQLCDLQTCKPVIVIMGYGISVKVIKMVWDDATSTHFNHTGRGAMKKAPLRILGVKLQSWNEHQPVIKGKLALGATFYIYIYIFSALYPCNGLLLLLTAPLWCMVVV